MLQSLAGCYNAASGLAGPAGERHGSATYGAGVAIAACLKAATPPGAGISWTEVILGPAGTVVPTSWRTGYSHLEL